MKRLLLFIIATLGCLQSFCQDVMYTKNKGALEVKVKEITDVFIKYHLYSNPDGPAYTTTKKYVDSIKYENGVIERFTIAPEKRFGRLNRDVKLKESFTNQLSAGIWAFGNDATNYAFSSPVNEFKNNYAAALFVRYETELLRKRVGISITPFVAFNKKAYGGALGATFNIKRFGKFNIGVGPEYLLTVQDIVELFHTYTQEAGNFNYYKKYHSTVSIMSFIVNMNMNISPKLSIKSNVGAGGIIGSSNRRDYMPASAGYTNGTVGNFKLGIGYWF